MVGATRTTWVAVLACSTAIIGCDGCDEPPAGAGEPAGTASEPSSEAAGGPFPDEPSHRELAELKAEAEQGLRAARQAAEQPEGDSEARPLPVAPEERRGWFDDLGEGEALGVAIHRRAVRGAPGLSPRDPPQPEAGGLEAEGGAGRIRLRLPAVKWHREPSPSFEARRRGSEIYVGDINRGADGTRSGDFYALGLTIGPLPAGEYEIVYDHQHRFRGPMDLVRREVTVQPAESAGNE